MRAAIATWLRTYRHAALCFPDVSVSASCTCHDPGSDSVGAGCHCVSPASAPLQPQGHRSTTTIATHQHYDHSLSLRILQYG